jgi:hypothetical protein
MMAGHSCRTLNKWRGHFYNYFTILLNKTHLFSYNYSKGNDAVVLKFKIRWNL